MERVRADGAAETALPEVDPDLDVIVAEASRLASAPAFIGFVEDGIERIAASNGWNVKMLPRGYSLAAVVAGQSDPMVVADARNDPRLAQHPLVAAAPFVRFFASAPIVDGGGTFLGALTAVDRSPRQPATNLHELLRLLALRVTDRLALRDSETTLRRRVRSLLASLDESNGRFRDFFERTTDLIASVDADGRLLHANEAFISTLALTREEVAGQPITRVIEAVAQDAFRLAFREVIATARPQSIETVLVTAGGRLVNVEGTFHPKVIDGRAVLARVMLHDISERKAFEAELGYARDAALEAARLKTQFLTNVSHEIRTPMNGIVGMIDLLLASALNEEQSDFAHQARASAGQLLSIVNNVLYVSNVQSGGLAAANVDFDLYRLSHRIVEVMKVAALGKEVEVSLDWDHRLPVLFRGNQSKLRQVISNLMENAIKFTEQGKIVLRVKRQMETDSHIVVRIEVSDTGIGISAEDRLLLFEKFSQLEATQTRRFQGVGLGLATARHLVETMGGLIDVESSPGVGSTFWLTITFPRPSDGQAPIASAELSFSGQRVLLIDRNSTSRRMVRHYLETTSEMRVDSCDSGTEALTMMRAAASAGDPYRVALFDRMSDFDEHAFARAVRADAAIARTGLVFLAVAGKALNEETMREAGIQSYALKPVGQAELFDAITIALAGDALGHERSVLARTVRRHILPPLPVPAEKRESVRLLLVEDNFLNRKLTMSQLQKLGYRADSASNGREALEALGAADYAIVVMDCQMPVMDGYEATTQIRLRDGDSRHRYVIAMTANALDGDREKCLGAGMDDYLAKPTRQEDLEIALARYFA